MTCTFIFDNSCVSEDQIAEGVSVSIYIYIYKTTGNIKQAYCIFSIFPDVNICALQRNESQMNNYFKDIFFSNFFFFSLFVFFSSSYDDTLILIKFKYRNNCEIGTKIVAYIKKRKKDKKEYLNMFNSIFF